MTRRTFGQTPRMRNGRYQARYTGPDAEMHTAGRTFGAKIDAEGWLAAESRLVDQGLWTPPAQRRAHLAIQQVAESTTLRVFADRVVHARSTRNRNPLRPSTRDNYDKCLRLVVYPALGDIPVGQLTPAIIRNWHDSLPQNPTQNGNAYNLLSSILRDAVEEGLLASNPCRLKGAGKPAPARAGIALTLEELSRYLDALAPQHQLLLTLSALGALRSGEARALRRQDLDLQQGVIRVRQNITRVRNGQGGWAWHFGAPKTAAGIRDVYLPRAMLPRLRALLSAQPIRGKDGLLFTGQSGQPLNGSVMRDGHKAALKAAGLPEDVQLHDLRRTALTLAAEGGATVAELQRLAGHTTAAMAMHYQRPTMLRDQERAERLGAALTATLGGKRED